MQRRCRVCANASAQWPPPIFIWHSQLVMCSLCFCHRNWCAYVVTRTVSCVMEDGVETYIKPDYQRCTWGQCPRVAWVCAAHLLFFLPFLSLLRSFWHWKGMCAFGATPTVSFPHFSRLLNHHSIHVLPAFFPVADTGSTELLLFSPRGQSFPGSVWWCLDMRVARTSPKM